MEKLKIVMEKLVIVLRFIGKMLNQGLQTFIAFMMKPKPNGKLSKRKFILLGLVILVVWFQMESLSRRPHFATSGAESVTISQIGNYAEGQKIKSGTYYVVLTELETNGDSNEIGLSVLHPGYHDYEWFSSLGETVAISIPKNATIEVTGNVGEFTLSFYTEQDYLEGKIEEKYRLTSSQSSTTVSSSYSSSSLAATSTSTSQSSTSSTVTSTTTSSSSSLSVSTPVEMDVNQFTSQYDTGNLEKNKLYQVKANLVDKEFWGWNADRTSYTIYILGADPDGIESSFILRISEQLANELVDSESATLTLQVRNDDFVYVTSAIK
ncbi:TPA: hypothetical protein ACF9FI_000427 [Streptococcus suis]